MTQRIRTFLAFIALGSGLAFALPAAADHDDDDDRGYSRYSYDQAYHGGHGKHQFHNNKHHAREYGHHYAYRNPYGYDGHHAAPYKRSYYKHAYRYGYGYKPYYGHGKY